MLQMRRQLELEWVRWEEGHLKEVVALLLELLELVEEMERAVWRSWRRWVEALE